MTRNILILPLMLCVIACTTTNEAATTRTQQDTTASSKPLPKSPGNSAQGAVLGISAPATTASSDQADDLVCRKERVTGSKFKKEVCRSAAEVKAEEESTQDTLRDFVLRTP
jgi:HJR/Mrr/RecB family endonuclease